MSLLVRNQPATIKRAASLGSIPAIPAPSMATGGPGYAFYTFEALQIAAVVACVGLRAGAFTQLPLRAYRDTATGAEEVPTQPDIVRNPSNHVKPGVWKTQMSMSRDIWGYAMGPIKAVDAAGYPSKVDWICPDQIRHQQDADGGLHWWINGQPIDRSLVVHVPSRWVLPGNPIGISPLEYTGLVDLAKKAQDFGRDWFRNGAMPSQILYSDQELNSEQADGILATMLGRWRNRKPAVIGSGMKLEQVSVAANESQFLETCRQASADIAVSFNLPPEKIAAAVSGQSVTYANREQNQEQYLVDSINPDLVVIQEYLEALTPRGQYLRWKTGAFLRSDLKTRYESYQVGINARFLTPDEARSYEDMPPLTDEQKASFPKPSTPPRSA